KLRESIDADFPDADKAAKELHRLLDVDEADAMKKTVDARAANDATMAQLAKLIKRLDEVLASMEKLTNINKLIAMLLHIEETLGKEELQYRKMKDTLENELFEGIEAAPAGKKPEKKR